MDSFARARRIGVGRNAMSVDGAYFRLRAKQELDAADSTGSAVAAEIHRELAQRFLAMAEAGDTAVHATPMREPQ